MTQKYNWIVSYFRRSTAASGGCGDLHRRERTNQKGKCRGTKFGIEETFCSRSGKSGTAQGHRTVK